MKFKIFDNLMFYISSILIPSLFVFESLIIVPKFYYFDNIWYKFHLVIALYILFNASLNFYFLCTVNTSIKGVFFNQLDCENGRYCSICECYCPPRSYHCSICKTCILRRDHHCVFSGSCVGLHNHRYYIITIFYCLIAAAYGSYFNIWYSLQLYNEYKSWQMFLIFLFPLFSYVIRVINFHQFIVSLGTLICFVTSLLLFVLGLFHMKLIILNRTMNENAKNISSYSKKSIILNIQSVLGRRYVSVWFWPLIHSS